MLEKHTLPQEFLLLLIKTLFIFVIVGQLLIFQPLKFLFEARFFGTDQSIASVVIHLILITIGNRFSLIDDFLLLHLFRCLLLGVSTFLLLFPVQGTLMLDQLLVFIWDFLVFEYNILSQKFPYSGNIIREFIIEIRDFVFG